jgi:hypothetical protein
MSRDLALSDDNYVSQPSVLFAEATSVGSVPQALFPGAFSLADFLDVFQTLI